jgi:AbrB family looped-hinge helix DNA binding protein
MTILEISKITTKGQITIPNRVRKLLHLKEGASVAFGLSKEGVVLMPCEVTAKFPYSAKEWAKIEKLTAEKGKLHQSADDAKAHIAAL